LYNKANNAKNYINLSVFRECEFAIVREEHTRNRRKQNAAANI